MGHKYSSEMPYDVAKKLLNNQLVLCCVALRCVALRCVALRCVALRCVALRCVALRCVVYKSTSSTKLTT